ERDAAVHAAPALLLYLQERERLVELVPILHPLGHPPPGPQLARGGEKTTGGAPPSAPPPRGTAPPYPRPPHHTPTPPPRAPPLPALVGARRLFLSARARRPGPGRDLPAAAGPPSRCCICCHGPPTSNPQRSPFRNSSPKPPAKPLFARGGGRIRYTGLDSE